MAEASPTPATTLKDEGNKLFQEGSFLKAAAVYSQAIKEDPTNHVLYSNRSAALLKLKKVTKAMEDAEKCIQLRPDWEKGYFRKGAVLEELNKLSEALEVYQEAHKLNPNSKDLVQKIRNVTKLVKGDKKGASSSQPKAPTEPAAAPAPAPAAPPPAAAAQGQANASEVVYEDLGSEEVAKFTEEFLVEVAGDIRAHGVSFPPTVHFLPGPDADSYEEHQLHIRGAGAFDSPDAHNGFVDFLRQSAERLDAAAIIALVPRDGVGYPRTWTKSNWPCGSGSGVLAMLEARKGVRKCWYIPVNNREPGTPTSISAADFALLPPVLPRS